MRRLLRGVTSWRPVLRLARRDARRHLSRTVLAAALIAVPIAGLVAVTAVSASGPPTRDQALATLPNGVQALITATALPRDAPPFAQLPEGPPGPWMDDLELLPATSAELAARLAPGTELFEYWLSPPLIVSTALGLAPGEQRGAGDGAEALDGIEFASLSTAQLLEAEPASLPFLAPPPRDGRLPESPTEVLLSEALADRLGLGAGDTLAFLAAPDSGWRSTEGNTVAAMQNSERGYRVVGISDGAVEQAWSVSGWLSELVAQNPGGIQRHWIAVGDAVTWDQAKALNELQAFAVSRQVLNNYPAAAELYPVSVDADAVIEQAIGVVVTAILGGLLVLFLVTPAFAVSAEQSRRSLGLAAAAGASPRDLRRTVLAQGIVLGCVGGVLGAGLGLAASLGATAWLESLSLADAPGDQRFSVASMLAHYPWWVLPVGVLLALLLGSLAALQPARAAAAVAPIDALRDRRPVRIPRRGRVSRIIAAASGPSLLVTAVVAGAFALLVPPGAAAGDPAAAPGAAPSTVGVLVLLVIVALILAAAGTVLIVRALLAWVGGRGRQARPALRFALRDTADHPSRSVPAILGVLFAVMAASYVVVIAASAVSNSRDGGGELSWDGTFMASPRVAVNDDFDRLVSEAAIDDARARFPQIDGSVSISEVGTGSSLKLSTLLPAGVDCPAKQSVHTASAIRLGAPLRCVDQNSRAAFSPSFRIGGLASTSDTMLFSGDALRATRLVGAPEAAAVLDAGGVVVNNAALINAAGLVRVAVDPEHFVDEDHADRIVELPGAFLQGAGAPFLIAPDTAQQLGVDVVHYLGEIATVIEPLDQRALLSFTATARFAPLVYVAVPDAPGLLSGSPEPLASALVWTPILLLGAVAVAATAIAVLLSATQGRRDAATLHAIGAGRGLLVRLGLARAAVILAIGLPAGLAAGIGLGAYHVAWNRHLEVSGAWLSTVPAWEIQAGIGLGVLVAGLLAALLLTRPPRRFERRGLD